MQDNELAYRESMLEIYMFETVQMVEQLEELLIDIEKEMSIGSTAINEIFRIMHTIKGSSAMMMYDSIALLAHKLEDLFALLRNGDKKEIDCHQLTEIVLQTVDFIKAALNKIQNRQEATESNESIIQAIELFEKNLDNEVPACNSYSAHIFFEASCEMENMRAYTVVHQLEPVAKIIDYSPSDILENEDSAIQVINEGFKISFISEKSYDELLEHFDHTLFLEKIDLQILPTEMETATKETKTDASNLQNGDLSYNANNNPNNSEITFEEFEKINNPNSLKENKSLDSFGIQKNSSTNGTNQQSMPDLSENKDNKNLNSRQSLISVNVKKMDQLMDLMGELVISEAMVTNNPELEGLELASFSKASRQLRKLTDELQDVVMSMRLIPISNTFQKMQRLVRDMKRKLDKEVNLELIGEETEIDKNIADNLSDPLMHIIRNALDHGIEDKETRKINGKSETGTITIEAKNAGGDVWVTVKDDGAGLSKTKLYNKAKEKGLVTKSESEYTEKEVFNFILLPGFSTKDKVTEFSGRGVGMDVVKENISKLGGSIQLESKTGVGTSMRIRIPMTLAIIDGILVAVGSEKYIVPTTVIRESFRPVTKQIINDTEGNELIMIRGECYRILRLHERFAVETKVKNLVEGIIVVIEDEDHSLCVFADELIGKQQVVVKPIPSYLRKSQALAGCTILGDGNISLILDAKGLMG